MSDGVTASDTIEPLPARPTQSQSSDFVAVPATGAAPPDVLCFSHLRWDFVYQRPQHLLSRCAQDRRVWFYEEPVFHHGPARLDVRATADVHVVVPHLPVALDGRREATDRAQRRLVDELIETFQIEPFLAWFYSPMALGFSRHLQPVVTIYDCMDELSGFLGAPAALRERERELFARADLVFTGGHSLYEAKRSLHPAVHALPSSIDIDHFARARTIGPSSSGSRRIGRELAQAEDQVNLPQPRIGYFGVIDERIDLELLAAVADARPDWSIVMVGPIVKIDPHTLPRRPNLHYLGAKRYAELPAYIASWDVAIMPFARNDATRFISPTKTPEYLAAGRPVVSTSIRDVIRPYAQLDLVAIADRPAEFVAAIEAQLAVEDRGPWLARVDEFLAGNSWDSTWSRMRALIDCAIQATPVSANGSVDTAKAATSPAELRCSTI